MPVSSSNKQILLAEDDTTTREAWSELLTSWGFKVAAVENGEDAIAALDGSEPEVLLLDLAMPKRTGLEVLEEIKNRGLSVITVVITGEGDLPEAVKAVKLGAYDFLRKPVDPDRLRILLNNILQLRETARENTRLRRRLIGAGELGELIGNSPAMRRVMNLIEQVAASTASVIITGESGTGKDLAARTLHGLSTRRTGPFVAINCAAIPDTLMESQLFGHERGAFTGADRRQSGCFELANGGTMLLDEITEMKVELQAKLLRVIEERKLRRVGGAQEIPLDVRVLAASNRNIAGAIREGRLREDLYYRLNVFTIEMPALREHREDIPMLIDRFVERLARPGEKRVFSQECLNKLMNYSWPGNVRQLRNIVERALIVSNGPMIRLDDLPPEFRSIGGPTQNFEVRLGSSLDDVEKELMMRTIEFADGNKTKAAEILGISLKTLYNRLQRYDDNGGSDRGQE